MNGSPDPWVLASIASTIIAALFGVIGGSIIARRVVFSRPPDARPVMAYLLIALVLMSLAQFVEQSRIMVNRLVDLGSLPEWLSRDSDYVEPLTIATKLMIAATISFATVLKIALYRGAGRDEALRQSYIASAVVILLWVALGFVIKDSLWRS